MGFNSHHVAPSATIPKLLCCITFRFTTIAYIIMMMRVFIRNIAVVIVVGSIARCIRVGVPRLPIRPCDERPPAMYGHFCLVPRVSVHDRHYCIDSSINAHYLLNTIFCSKFNG